MNVEALAREYYEAIDEGEYERLRELLDPDFVQERSDRTFEGRDEFVSFMRDDRPETDTTHEVDYVTADGDRVVVEGRLQRANGELWFRFADAFGIEDGRLVSLRTYTV